MKGTLPVALEGRCLACRRGGRVLFAGLDIALAPRSLVWLRGANGSGKTSLLRILAGLTPPAAGSVRAPAAQPILVGHSHALKDDLSVHEVLCFQAELAGLPHAAQRTERALQAMGLTARRDHLVRTLSQGWRRRTALARLALDDRPAAWLLDEPLDALDADGVERLGQLLAEHRARGGAVLFTSHQPPPWSGVAEFDIEHLINDEECSA